ncbi:cation diffusion facilitator family transporter [uncultured Muribaculum sp.]|uniref:cation diffusion facilitator family transporter n=1 Tax=uncultured Muribaculum sp. TaxID=1918613 RepID=UPI0025F377A4|nr:cation diffusion facilitator family transporter [uncultured Muribaculum sp.]
METHSHSHHHTHALGIDTSGRLKRAFKLGIWLNALYVALEVVFGFITNSMGLLSDAGHNLSDILSLAIALIALRVSRNKPTAHFTYGFRRATVNASVVNSIILYVAVALILFESIRKLVHPVAVDGDTVAWVAAVGVLVNGVTAWLFMKDSHGDLNVRGAFLHMAADTLVSIGVVVSGIVIACTGWTLIDPIVGIVIAIVIAVGSYGMLRESLCLAFDGVPRGIDVAKVTAAISAVKSVEDVHHMHIWALSTTETAMTVHVVVSDSADVDRIICEVRRVAAGFGVVHSTVEVETAAMQCDCSHCR